MERLNNHRLEIILRDRIGLEIVYHDNYDMFECRATRLSSLQLTELVRVCNENNFILKMRGIENAVRVRIYMNGAKDFEQNKSPYWDEIDGATGH